MSKMPCAIGVHLWRWINPSYKIMLRAELFHVCRSCLDGTVEHLICIREAHEGSSLFPIAETRTRSTQTMRPYPGLAVTPQTNRSNSVQLLDENASSRKWKQTLAQEFSSVEALPAILERGSNSSNSNSDSDDSKSHPTNSTMSAGSASSAGSLRKRKLRRLRRKGSMPAVDAANNAHNGPIFGTPFAISSEYLREYSLSLLEDLVSLVFAMRGVLVKPVA